MTVEALQQRKGELLAQMQQVAAHLEQVTKELHQLAGQVQDCDYWLAKLSTPAGGTP